MKILVVNGPNLNLLGLREPELYGMQTYADMVKLIETYCAEESIEVRIFQSNHEGVLVDEIQSAHGVYDGIVINPAAYTHTSIALLDALKAVGILTVEVHISDTEQREAFRRISYVRGACIRTIQGRGLDGYTEAIQYLKNHIIKRTAP